MKRRQSITEQYMTRLQNLAVGHSFPLSVSDGRYARRAIWRHAANKLGHRVSIKTTPDGMRLWRLN